MSNVERFGYADIIFHWRIPGFTWMNRRLNISEITDGNFDLFLQVVVKYNPFIMIE